MLGEGGEVLDFPLGAVGVDPPEADVVVTAGGGQTPLTTGFEVSRVDGGVLVVPIDDEGVCLHRVLWRRLVVAVHGMEGWMWRKRDARILVVGQELVEVLLQYQH